MTFKEFYLQFPDEASCKIHFKNYREKVGVTCKKCESQQHYWLKTIEYYKCKQCGFRTSLRSGTLLENSKLPYEYWYTAFCMMSNTKKSFSALEVQRQIGHEHYEPVWELMHKIRIVMGKRDSEYLLKECVEADEGFFVTVPEKGFDEHGNKVEKESLKRGKGSQRSSKVLVLAESIPVNDNKNPYKPNRAVKHIKMLHVTDTKAETLLPEINVSVDSNAIVITDGANHYNGLKSVVRKHVPIVMTGEKADKHLPWVHKAISNSKRNIVGIHHAIGMPYTQNYLNEFCFKFNRRFNGIDVFDRLINVAVQYQWDA